MNETIDCLVSRRQLRSVIENGEIELNTLQVITCSVSDNNRKIFIGQGWHGHDPGGVTTAAQIIAREREGFRNILKDGKIRYEPEPSGWFDRQCGLLDCPWFPAIVRRMASGEIVPFEEIRNAYRIHNKGEEIPVGTWEQLRFKECGY